MNTSKVVLALKIGFQNHGFLLGVDNEPIVPVEKKNDETKEKMQPFQTWGIFYWR